MEVRYEVSAIINHRGRGDKVEYEVQFAKWPTTSWEVAETLVGANAALRAYEKRCGKNRKQRR